MVAGCLQLNQIRNFLAANARYVMLHQGIYHPSQPRSQQEIDIANDATQKALDTHAKFAFTLSKYQQALFVAGGLIFMAWKIALITGFAR